MNSKGMNAMPALSKFLVLLALVLSASHANAFTSLGWVAGNQVRINHLTRVQQPMSYPTNEPSREPIREPTKRVDLNALLPNNLSQINNAVLSNHSKQRVSFADQLLMKRSIIQLLIPTVSKIDGICQHQSILILFQIHEQV